MIAQKTTLRFVQGVGRSSISVAKVYAVDVRHLSPSQKSAMNDFLMGFANVNVYVADILQGAAGYFVFCDEGRANLIEKLPCECGCMDVSHWDLSDYGYSFKAAFGSDAKAT